MSCQYDFLAPLIDDHGAPGRAIDSEVRSMARDVRNNLDALSDEQLSALESAIWAEQLDRSMRANPKLAALPAPF